MAKEQLWTCPNCRDYVDVSSDICPRCKKRREAGFKVVSIDTGCSNKIAFLTNLSMNKLFSLSNPGKRLKWFAKVDFVCAIIVGIICAVVLPYDKWGNFQFWKVLGYLVGGFVAGYIAAVPVYAFGPFVEDTAENKETLHRIEEQLKQNNQHNEETNEQ